MSTGKMMAMCAAVVSLLLCLGCIAFPVSAYADDPSGASSGTSKGGANADSKDYASTFMEGIGWDQSIATEMDPNVDGDLENTSKDIADKGWNLLYSIDKLLIGFAFLFFAARIAGRGMWELAFGGGDAEPPAFLQTSSGSAKKKRKPQGGDAAADFGGEDAGWLASMCIDAIKGFLVAVGVVFILNVVAGFVLFGLGLLPPPDIPLVNL